MADVVDRDVVGLLHPGEMGAAIGGALREQGRSVAWASEGRSEATVRRAERAGLRDAGPAHALADGCAVLLSVCPPHAATDVAHTVAGFTGVYVDANAVAPETVRRIRDLVADAGGRLVDGGIIGPPPHAPGRTRLYLSGPEAATVADLFAGTVVDARVVGEEVGAASALKMAYAAWTKGTAALLLTVRSLAQAEHVDEALLAEWQLSQPELPDRHRSAARSAAVKGWRWAGEMDEIAAAMAAAELPAGFHRAAAEVFRDT